jgi:hypothetical protein
MRTGATNAGRMILADDNFAAIVFAAGQAGPCSATILTSITATCGSARCAWADYGKPEAGGMT